MKKTIAKIAVISGIFILLSLGIWQLFRMKQKYELIEILNARTQMENIQVSKIDDDILYRNVTICGKYISSNDMLVYANPYYITLSPFRISNSDEIILVARGRIHQEQQIDQVNYQIDDEQIDKCIVGMVVNSEKITPFMPHMDGTYKKPFLSINVHGIEEIIGQNLVNYYLIQTANTQDLAELGMHPMAVKSPEKIYNNHLEYALTWFMLAAILFFMFAATIAKNRK